MKRPPAWLALMLALTLAVPPAAGQAGGDGDGLEILIVLPTFSEALFGEVEVGATISPSAQSIARVEFYLDSRLVGVAESPPFTRVVDAGQENVEHHFQVVAHTRSGESLSSGVWTPRIETDDEVNVDLQQLYVTVERGGERFLGLKREDFAVFDNGARQQLITFERGDVPFTAVLLVDASGSMKGRRLPIAIEGAEAFVRGMNELDQAKLVLFSDRLLYETPFTTFPSVLTVGLARVEAGGGTALNDHLYQALKRLETRQGRRVVLILSDGVDIESVLPIDWVRWIASQKQPVVYWIRLSEKTGHQSMWRNAREHEEQLEVLRRTVLESGGRIETLGRIDDVKQAFEEILEDLRNQYVLGYYPSESASRRSWHKVEVRVREQNLDVRARGGYLEASVWPGNER